MNRRAMTFAACLMLAAQGGAGLQAAERTENFDVDPQWDAHNNRSTAFQPQRITQRFGFSPTHHAGGAMAGEMGGLVNPAAEAAFYAKKIPDATFDDRLTASGVMAMPGEQPFHAVLGFFNAGTLNEWRTPNTIAIRLQGRGEMFYAYVEYCTSRWRAGADNPGGFSTIEGENGRRQLRGFKTRGAVHRWNLTYDPQAQNGLGSIALTIDGETAVCHLDPGHKQEGARFNRFGLMPVMKQWDQPGEVWFDDVIVNGRLETFDKDPGWEGRDNQRTYVSSNVRPRFDFGFSPTHFAGGAKAGELGGLVFRGDIRQPDRMGHYGARIDTLTLAKPLHAGGAVALRRGVSDSTTILGFYNSRDSLTTNPSQNTGWPKSFLGVAIEGPSRVGFQFYPAFHDATGHYDSARSEILPTILPNGAPHRWTLDYAPPANGKPGAILVNFDGQLAKVELPSEIADLSATTFDRFGLVTAWIDGNGQQVYFDDLTYTWRQE